jgi:hypothetical protein
MTEGKSAEEYSDTGKDGIEEVEGTHGTYTDEIKESAFDT